MKPNQKSRVGDMMIIAIFIFFILYEVGYSQEVMLGVGPYIRINYNSLLEIQQVANVGISSELPLGPFSVGSMVGVSYSSSNLPEFRGYFSGINLALRGKFDFLRYTNSFLFSSLSHSYSFLSGKGKNDKGEEVKVDSSVVSVGIGYGAGIYFSDFSLQLELILFGYSMGRGRGGKGSSFEILSSFSLFSYYYFSL